MYGGLDDGQIQEYEWAGTKRGCRRQCLYGNGILIGHSIGVYLSRPTQASTYHEAQNAV
jgi:hypothetical protein